MEMDMDIGLVLGTLWILCWRSTFQRRSDQWIPKSALLAEIFQFWCDWLRSHWLNWHGLVLQSSVRSSLPSGKKKKKVGSDQPTSPVSHAIRDSIKSLCGTVEHVTKWLREQIINRPEDENLETILSYVQKKGQNEGGPGQVFKILETWVSSINETQLGERISQAVKSWSPVDVARKIVTGKCRVASEFLKICESKLKSLHAMKQRIAQV
jgi:N-terminal acetyltransferase B complex non-catalytic subunit